MFYVLLDNARAVNVTTEYPELGGQFDARYENRNDWKTLDRAVEIAAQLTQALGRLFIGTDAGPSVSPRYDVIEMPKLGDKVSKAFNGDYYPEGEITKVSKSLTRIETSTGAVFYRRKLSGAWINNGTWSLVPGHVFRTNPCF